MNPTGNHLHAFVFDELLLSVNDVKVTIIVVVPNITWYKMIKHGKTGCGVHTESHHDLVEYDPCYPARLQIMSLNPINKPVCSHPS